ncbi:uncharacterized protein LOC110093954 [Dendrobium catenatum]|uniref:Uncharacterized protein n=1 Tax=Dendrobium catenatum TaxID=906689 RepID=A0A2I0VJ54_9ASPA|nr:uncharacterized protein LOC110093954 [Dendrobium catenatum]PKU63447.1 hypothetical protein MA16_Dca024941 [Dendrobium catenatum]
MGCCLSSFPNTSPSLSDDDYSVDPPTAMVISVDGSLIEYNVGITTANVIEANGKGCILCNSDKLFFDAYPPVTAPEEVLEPDQIYFLLPVSELGHRLTGADLAALAFRASAALRKATETQGRRRGIIKVAPLTLPCEAAKENKGSPWLRRVLSTVKEIHED